jgi:hypothetical protein
MHALSYKDKMKHHDHDRMEVQLFQLSTSTHEYKHNANHKKIYLVTRTKTGNKNGLSLLALLPSSTVRPDSSGSIQKQILTNLNHASNR